MFSSTLFLALHQQENPRKMQPHPPGKDVLLVLNANSRFWFKIWIKNVIVLQQRAGLCHKSRYVVSCSCCCTGLVGVLGSGICVYALAYVCVHSRAVWMAAFSSSFHLCATSLASGSSGFGAPRRAWIESRMVRICSAGDQLPVAVTSCQSSYTMKGCGEC